MLLARNALALLTMLMLEFVGTLLLFGQGVWLISTAVLWCMHAVACFIAVLCSSDLLVWIVP